MNTAYRMWILACVSAVVNAATPTVHAEVQDEAHLAELASGLDLGSEGSTAGPNGTQIEKLSKLFEAGHAPDRKAILGWWTGREYVVKGTSAKPSLLLGAAILPPNNEGPLFPKEVEYRFVPIENSRAAPDYFDRVESYERAVEQQVANWINFYHPSEVRNDAIVSQSVTPALGYELREVVLPVEGPNKVAQAILVMKFIATVTTPEVRVGDVVAWNYYFKRVRAK